MTTRKLAQLAVLADGTEARTLVRQLNQTYDRQGRAVRVEQVAGGYRLMTRPALAPWLVKLGYLPPTMRLSTPMMETLAVVAYRQPVSRAAAEAIRGVACGELLRQLMERDKTHIVAMTGSYFRGDAEAVLHPDDEAKFETVTYTYYEQLNGYQYLKQLDIGYYFYSGSYTLWNLDVN